jgi:hypothetical protein
MDGQDVVGRLNALCSPDLAESNSATSQLRHRTAALKGHAFSVFLSDQPHECGAATRRASRLPLTVRLCLEN